MRLVFTAGRTLDDTYETYYARVILTRPGKTRMLEFLLYRIERAGRWSWWRPRVGVFAWPWEYAERSSWHWEHPI